ncbi:MAG: hypothetical protein AAFN27_12815 [Pseudomonadota bacterium]
MIAIPPDWHAPYACWLLAAPLANGREDAAPRYEHKDYDVAF